MRNLFSFFSNNSQDTEKSSSPTVSRDTQDRCLTCSDRDFSWFELGWKIFQVLTVQNPKKNVLISPTSIATLLNVLYDGARAETREELANVLGITDWSSERIQEAIRTVMSMRQESETDVELAIATSLWIDKAIQIAPLFAADVRRLFDAAIKPADIASPSFVDSVNEWVRMATRDKISSILDEAPSPLRLLAINAVYFKARWASAFNERMTREWKFTLTDGSCVRVPMMVIKGKFAYRKGSDFQAIHLPYLGQQFGMDILLPATSPRRFLRNFSVEKWLSIMSTYDVTEVKLAMPRFRFDNNWQLEHVFRQLGLMRAFDKKHADFSGITQDRLWLDGIVHKTFVEVTEKGTEAAAVTAATMLLGLPDGWKPPIPLILDRPFIIAIREQVTGTVLFVGVVEDPRAQSDGQLA